jgi:predicted DNA-binding transcriptional regulator AlpA
MPDSLDADKRDSRTEVAPGFLRPRDAATYLSISESLLAKLVRMGQGPRQRRCGRAVLYKIADLDAFMEVCS